MLRLSPLHRHSRCAGRPQATEERSRAGCVEPTGGKRDPADGAPAPSNASGSYNLNLSISLSGLNLLPDGEIWAGKVDVFLVQRDQRGKEFGRVNPSRSRLFPLPFGER